MTFESTITTRSLVAQAKRFNAKRGDLYIRTIYRSLSDYATTQVKVSRTTANFVFFSDGGYVARDSGRSVKAKTSGLVTCYAPAV